MALNVFYIITDANITVCQAGCGIGVLPITQVCKFISIFEQHAIFNTRMIIHVKPSIFVIFCSIETSTDTDNAMEKLATL